MRKETDREGVGEGRKRRKRKRGGGREKGRERGGGWLCVQEVPKSHLRRELGAVETGSGFSDPTASQIHFSKIR